MCRLVLKLDPKLVFPLQRTLSKDILLAMVAKCLDFCVQPFLDATPMQNYI
jgi:hypothetical protein